MEQTTSELFVPMQKARDAFGEHLSLPNNNRILFSGKYGSGKTTFLKEFYKNENGINVFHLFPVNYQVAENNDIFELIKFDILTILIEKDLVERDEEIGRSLVLQNYLMTKGANVVLRILEDLPKLGKVMKHMEKFAQFLSGFNGYYEEINRAKETAFNRYIKEIRNKEGSLYEFDFISSMIKSSIDKQRGDKKNVLIVDDLDRMDPAHIFRIMNVFSAHFDQMNYWDGESQLVNKFGFDKIIMVCDLDNIRKLFHSFYGVESDFGGYIDKFFSMRIFQFNLKNEILGKIDEIFQHYNDNYPRAGGSIQQMVNHIKPIVSDFIDVSAINLRMINHLRDGELKFRNPYTIPNSRYGGLRNYNFIYMQVIDFLMDVFGDDYEKLLRAVVLAKQKGNYKMSRSKRGYHFQHLLPLLLDDQLDINSEVKHFSDSEMGIDIDYRFNDGNMSDMGLYYAKFDDNEQLAFLDHINFYTFLERALVNMKKHGFFEVEEE